MTPYRERPFAILNHRGAAPAMLKVSSIVSALLSSIFPGMIPKSLRLMLKVERMTRRSPVLPGTRYLAINFTPS